MARDLAPAAPDGAQRLRLRAESRRLEILRAAARTFRRLGFAATGMRDIAAEARLSSGNLYHYFRGKDEILYFCQDRTLDRLLDALERVRGTPDGATDAGADPAARLAAIVRAHVAILLDAIEGGTAHIELQALPADRRAAVVAKRDRYEAGIRTILEEGMATGRFAPGDAGLQTRAILGAINWPAFWHRHDGRQPVGEIADGMARFLTRGALAAGETR